jgi:hypothetical protein
MYDSVEEAGNRLNSTVITYDKSPVYVLECDGRKNAIKAWVLPMPSFRQKDKLSIRIDDPLCDYRSIPLGYTNCKKGSVLLSRIPVRGAGYKQGLHGGNINIQPVHPVDVLVDMEADGAVGVEGRAHDWNTLIRTSGFCNMVKGIYPSIPQCIDRLQKEKDLVSLAFNRYFTLCKDQVGILYLHYKGERVGYSEFVDRFKVPKNFQYLREVMAEHGVKVQ